MGRRKRAHKDLPVRMRYSHRAWYHVEKGKWTRLGDTFAGALAEYARIEGGKSERRDVNALLAAFLRHVEHGAERKLAANTLRSYKHHARKHGKLRAVFGHVMPASLTIADGRRYLDEHPKYSTARHEIGVLSAALSYGAERGWLTANPWLNWRKGAMKRRTRLISAEEWTAILAACPADLAECLRFLYVTALRVNDALALRWAHRKPDGLHVRIAKSKSEVVFESTSVLEERLRALRGLSVVSLHLMTVSGRRLTYPVLYKRFKAAARAAGCGDVTLHDIRRKRLTDLKRERGIEFAQAVAAHTDPKVTAGYVVEAPRVAI